jgi:colanic acid/amylovoran biosynthesis glycosyltransferase
MPTAEWPMAPHPAIKTGTKLLCIFLRKLWMRFLIYFAGRSSILHAHFSYMGWNYLWLAEMKKVPLVVSYYGCDYEYLPNHEPVWKERYRDMFRRVALFIAEGNAGRNKLIAMGCPEDKVKVVHLGVETSIIPFYRRNKNPGELKLVQVATFISKKGYDTTVNAFIQAVKKCPGLTLTLVGKDPEGMRGTLHQTIREHDLEGQVEFIDGIDFAKLHVFLKRFHVFIHPSRYGNKGDSEGGAPVVLLDAQATGLPVLSTTHCDIPEEVVDGVTGILVEENDVDGLARAIEIFYRMDEDEYNVFCEQARRHIERHYDAVTSGKQLRDAYKDVLTKSRGNR